MPRQLPCVLLSLLTVLLGGADAVAASPRFEVDAPPSWVEPIPFTAANWERTAGSETTLRVLLDSTQVKVEGGQAHRFSRRILRVTSEQGAADAGRLEVTFDPEYEQLTLHGAWRTRGDTRSSVLRPDAVRIIQKEKDLEAQLYDGSLTALMFIEDVRVGDVMEFAYSVRGSNPVFNGHYVDGFMLQRGLPIDHLSVRVLWPDDRPLHHRVHGRTLEPTVRPGSEHTEYRWEARALPAVAPEDSVPGDLVVYPWLQLSDFGTWENVVNWGLPLYTPPETLTPALQAQVEALRAAGTDDASRFIAAVRFVQDDIRYLGIEMGANSHQPHAPEVVLGQRFGDCKDKALLLSTLLQALGFEAAPALVNTRMRQGLDQRLPSAGNFDHAIVWARLGEQELWVDATAQLQRGDPAHMVPPPFRRGLVLKPGSVGLTEMPLEDVSEPLTDLEETWELQDEAGAATLHVRTTHRGSSANRMRSTLANQPIEDVARDYLNYYARDDVGIRATSPLQVQDDPVLNILTIEEAYAVDAFWRTGTRELTLSLLRQRLRQPEYPQRTFPFTLHHPSRVRHRIVVQGVGISSFPMSPDRASIKGPGWQLNTTHTIDIGTEVLEGTWFSTSDRIAPDQVKRHLEALSETWDATWAAVNYVSPEARQGMGFMKKFYTAIAGVFGVGFVLLLIIGWWGSKRLLKGPKVKPGTTMDSALTIRSEAELTRVLAAQRCQCGAQSPGLEGMTKESTLLLGGSERTSLRWTCGSCRRIQRTWVREDEASEAA